MASLFNNLSDQAREMLSDAFPTKTVVITLIQTHYLPLKGQTIFCVVAQVGSRIYAGSGESVGKAVEKMITEINLDSHNQAIINIHVNQPAKAISRIS